jgi:hypothetical protein
VHLDHRLLDVGVDPAQDAGQQVVAEHQRLRADGNAVVVAPMQRDHRVGHCGEERVAGKRRWGGHEGQLLVLRLGLARKAKGVTQRATFVAPL